MSSSYEQKISEIEDFIEECKFSAFSNTKILVDKEELLALMEELKLKTPVEIKKYQRMLANKNNILGDAQERAKSMLEEASDQANAMVNDHEITQQAYMQGNEILAKAQDDAQEIIDQANEEADVIRANAIQYTDNLLANVQHTITYSMENITMRYEAYMKSLQKTLQMVTENRNELNSSSQPQTKNYYQTQQAEEEHVEEETETEAEDELDELDLPLEDDEFEDYTVETDFDEEDE